jgi:surfeit locus 1 family protein
VWRIARRPKWIAALVLALAVAGVFAALGQWQLERSIEAATVIERDTETPVPLESVAEPQSVMTSDASGRTVSVDGIWVEGDEVVVTGRSSDGQPGDWVIRHLVTSDGASLAVVVGFVEPGASLAPLPGGEASLIGRYVPSESPQQSDFESGERRAIAVAELINLWSEVDTVYSGYLTAVDAPPGLTPIAAPPPEVDVELNLLNLFYAIEWVIFGGFAVYLWWRLVRDEYENELEAEALSEPA